MGKIIELPAGRRRSEEPVPPLESGDRLDRAEFEHRYEASPWIRKAELVEGVVHVVSPTKDEHAAPHLHVNTWLGLFLASTPGVSGGCEGTIRLDWDNEVQPDAFLRILPEHGGRCRPTEDGYLEGPPELVVEIASSRVSYDLHAKLEAYRRNGVCEYVAVRVADREVDWFVLRGGCYKRIDADVDGFLKSEVFPGLWLDPAALIRGDVARVLEALGRGLETPEHAALADRLGGKQ